MRELVIGMTITALDCFVLVYVLFYFLKHTEQKIFLKRTYYLFAFLGLFIMCFGIVVWNIGELVFLLCYSVSAIFIGYFLFHKNKMQIINTAIFCICLFVTLHGMIFFGVYIANLFQLTFHTVYTYSSFLIFIKLLGVVGVSRTITFFFAKRTIQNYGKFQIFVSLLIILCSLFFLGVITSISGFLNIYWEFGTILIVINCILLVLFNLFVGDILSVRSKNAELREELAVYEQQSKIQYKYYKDLEEKYHNTRKLVHDIRNHLHGVEQLYHMKEHEAGSQYAKEIHHKLNQLSQQYYCDHKMLNIILNDKLEKARNENIQVKVQIGEVAFERLSVSDITTIFANLLDNAIYAAGQVRDDPYLVFKIDKVRDFIVIDIRNSYVKMNSYQKKKKKTGIGLKNVRSVLNKYNGTIEIHESEREFQVNIVIPIDSDEEETYT